VTERCIVRVKFTRAGSSNEIRRAVGGFLRYVQYRDLHSDSKPDRPTPEIAGLLKYVAYRDRADARAELFGPRGRLESAERKEFAGFVARSIEGSTPQIFRSRDGRLIDRRRAVSRLIISPERAQGLDLNVLTRAAMARLESEAGMSGLRWIAAIHRKTKHHHVHLVLAGMHDDGQGGYRRADVTKPRLAAMKEALALEIQRQRGERTAFQKRPTPIANTATSVDATRPTVKLLAAQPAFIRTLPQKLPARSREASSYRLSGSRHLLHYSSSLIALRAVARRYQRQMQHEVADEARRLGWEHAA
jgi:hypothetical protein